MFKKKAQTAGLITGLIFGVASLVIGVIIAFVIVSTITGAGLLSSGRSSISIVNETGGYINNTGYTLAGASATKFVPGSISVSLVYNNTIGVIPASNYTVSSLGVVKNATLAVYNSGVNFTYTYSLYNNKEVTTTDLSKNFTKGVDNVSSKIPTILLVAAIVLILGVLAILVGVWMKMRMSQGNI